MHTTFDNQKLISMREAAEYLGITPQYMNRLIKKHADLFDKAVKIGRTWVIDTKQLKEFKDTRFLKQY